VNPSPSPRPRLGLVLAGLGAFAALVVLVVAHPRATSTTWSRGDDLALVVAWVVAVATSSWLFLATAACLVALTVNRPRIAHRLAPVLPARLRRMVEVAIVASCITLPALPAHAERTPPRPTVRVIVAPDQPPADQPVVRAAVRAPEPTRARPQAVTPAPVPKIATDKARRLIVRPGDNLWLIASAALAEAPGPPPEPHDVARYWRAVIAANRATLRSGNPSLIFPGEIVTLPPPTPVS
jgi:hypothetical protein